MLCVTFDFVCIYIADNLSLALPTAESLKIIEHVLFAYVSRQECIWQPLVDGGNGCLEINDLNLGTKVTVYWAAVKLSPF